MLYGLPHRPWRTQRAHSILRSMKGLRRRSSRSTSAIEMSITEVLADVTPLLRIDHCRLELAEFVPASGQLTVRINGTCPDCTGSPAMFATAIEAHVRQRVPEVRQVTIAEPDGA